MIQLRNIISAREKSIFCNTELQKSQHYKSVMKYSTPVENSKYFCETAEEIAYCIRIVKYGKYYVNTSR